MDDYRQPDDDAICSCEIEHQNVGADAELDQGHAVKIEQLAEPKPFQVFLQVGLSLDRVPDMSASTDRGRLVCKDGTKDC